MTSENDALARLSVPVYTTDTEGYITFYNDAAAEFWGTRPEIGRSKWCGAWRLYRPDGTPLEHHDSALAITLRERCPVVGADAVAERPDGTRSSFMPHPSLLTNEAGEVTGAINLLVDLSDRNATYLGQERLAAIVSSSDDIIISKTLDGSITSWNASATRILGFDEAEMLGQPILRIIPPELAHEEAEILGKIRRGLRIEHFDTERLTKDGRRVQLSLTVSPLRDRTGRIVGASKVARDITERKRHDELQKLLFNELNHRVKNTLATIQAIAAQSLRRATNPSEFVTSFSGRVQALARAHDLLVRGELKEARLADIIGEQVILGRSDPRIVQAGPDVRLEPQSAVQIALVLHELATNARKYGALSLPNGTLSIDWLVTKDSGLVIDWREGGLTKVTTPENAGFGSVLINEALRSGGGSTSIRFHDTGIYCHIRLPLTPGEQRRYIGNRAANQVEPQSALEPQDQSDLQGRRILIVEDDPLIALDVCDLLADEGMVVVGPARNLSQARHLVAAGAFEVALIDANLNGDPVDEIAASLSARGVPYAFCTGYGPEALPEGHQNSTILPKPFAQHELLRVVRALCFHAESVSRGGHQY
jgi:PAS domain S-box-containing protein